MLVKNLEFVQKWKRNEIIFHYKNFLEFERITFFWKISLKLNVSEKGKMHKFR